MSNTVLRRHNITEILLKVVLNTITLTPITINGSSIYVIFIPQFSELNGWTIEHEVKQLNN